MSLRTLLLIAFPLAVVSIGCGGSPTQADGIVSVTQTTSTTTTTSTSTTTSVIPQLNAGAVGVSPTGTGIAFATVYNFLFATPPSGGVPPYTIVWAFGDGSVGSGSAVSHVYTNTGSFTASATITDGRGISVQASAPVVVGNVTGTWVAKIAGFKDEDVLIVQNQAAVTATINDADNFLGLATGAGTLSNPRLMAVSVTFTSPVPPKTPFAATYIGRLDDNLRVWDGTVTGLAGCPCGFTATRH